jgi:membrane protein DedA with SNARE-associated domain
MDWLLAAILPQVPLQTVDTWMEAGGCFVLFGLLFACGLGLPLPEDIPLMVAGALVAREQMHLATAAVAAWCGIIGGDIVLYHLGKKFGLEITRVRFIGKHLTKARIERLEQMFDQYGILVVAVGRLFAGVRGVMVAAAGAARFNFWKFIITDGLAALVSGGFFISVGYWLGSRLDAKHINEFKDYFLLGVLVLLLGVLAWIFLRRKRAEERMEKVAAKVEHVAERVAHVVSSSPPPAPPSAPGQQK